ncbi:MAG: flagellar export chaperone FliS [Limnochordaceae bacterium]|nr:flagellar export chaperone FliS [Limnochordaceae bacterium]
MGYQQQVLGTYRKQQVETATPGQLIVMLYDAGIRNCKAAQEAIERKDRDASARHLLKAQDIVAELMSSLNVEAGGELGAKLLRLYEYMYRRLVHANVRKDAQAAKEVESLLAGLRDAWAQAAAATPAPAQAAGTGTGPTA